ncbi:MAG: chemotaxis protein CheW [Cucumibacter sp.]
MPPSGPQLSPPAGNGRARPVTPERGAWLAFRLAGRRLALPLADISRVLALPLLQPPVGAPGFVEGFFDFEGTPVAALRLDRLLRLEEKPMGVYSALLVLRDPTPPIALHVASVDSIVKTVGTDIQPIQRDGTVNACVTGRVNRDGETLYLLSTADLLLAEERARLASLHSMKQQRLAALAGPAGSPGEPGSGETACAS